MNFLLYTLVYISMISCVIKANDVNKNSLIIILERLSNSLSKNVYSFGLADPPLAPPGYVTFRDVGEQNEGICNRDVTSPINELDGQSNSSRGRSLDWLLVVVCPTHTHTHTSDYIAR